MALQAPGLSAGPSRGLKAQIQAPASLRRDHFGAASPARVPELTSWKKRDFPPPPPPRQGLGCNGLKAAIFRKGDPARAAPPRCPPCPAPARRCAGRPQGVTPSPPLPAAARPPLPTQLGGFGHRQLLFIGTNPPSPSAGPRDPGAGDAGGERGDAQGVGGGDRRRLRFVPGGLETKKWELLVFIPPRGSCSLPKGLGSFALRLVPSRGFREHRGSSRTSQWSSEAGAQRGSAETGLPSVAPWGERMLLRHQTPAATRLECQQPPSGQGWGLARAPRGWHDPC